MNPDAPERRASERTRLGLPCVYLVQRPVDPERWEFDRGDGRVLNMARGGMLLLLDHRPEVAQVVQVHLYHPHTGQTIALLRVVWTRRADTDGQYWAGGRFIFGPYAIAQERLCTPGDFFTPPSA